MNTALHFSSKRMDWETPWDLFRELDAEFRFRLDVCAEDHNHKVERYFSPEENGLLNSWHTHGAAWMNPPYGRAIGLWTSKAADEARGGATVVGLLPARTDTAWWHRDVIGSGAEVRFLRGRVRFEGAKHAAPFPSAIVVWRPRAAEVVKEG